MFISLGIRFEANVEALNMVETAGNYAKHRRVPYLVTENGRQKAVYVPALSGESLAHAYQAMLVKEAKALRLPVCEDCAKEEFFKSMNKKYLLKKIESIPSDPGKIEEAVVKSCVIEDVGGFLYAERPPVKRTSAFQVSYALPVKSLALLATMEPQLHARHAQMEDRERQRGEAAEQMIYYVETGTALYAFLFNLDLGAIGMSVLGSGPLVDEDEVKSRRKAAINALYRLISSAQFGAKLSRFFPVGGITEVAVAVTQNPFVITSPIYDDYLKRTKRRLEVLMRTFGEEYFFDHAGEGRVPEEVLEGVISYLSEKEQI